MQKEEPPNLQHSPPKKRAPSEGPDEVRNAPLLLSSSADADHSTRAQDSLLANVSGAEGRRLRQEISASREQLRALATLAKVRLTSDRVVRSNSSDPLPVAAVRCKV